MTNPEEIKFVEALCPAADAAGRTGDYVSLKNCAYVDVVAHIDQGAADTVALTIEQAKAVDGTDSTAITKTVPIWANEDCAAGDTMARQTDAVSFTTSAAIKHKVVRLRIDASKLDDGYDCITIKTGASNVANITQAMYVMGVRYAQATPPSAITD